MTPDYHVELEVILILTFDYFSK